MAERPLYVIVDWDVCFETYESARVKAGNWVAQPTKHDGKSFRRLMREKDATALYGAWALVVQVAKKLPWKGVLADADGPLDAQDIEDKTFANARIVERMLEVVTSERVGWMRCVREPAEIAAYLAEVRGRLAVRPARSAGAPARAAGGVRVNGGLPAELNLSPADCGQLRNSAGTPADVAGTPAPPTEVNAPRGRARADRTGQDKTVPPIVPQGGPESEGSLSALEDTTAFLCGLFGRKKSRLGMAAEAELARFAESLPLSTEQKKMLAAFHAAPADESDITLRARPDSAEGWARHLMALLDRAKKWAEKNGGVIVPVSAPRQEPPGAREWYEKNYAATMPWPGSWWAVPESVRSEFELARSAAR